MDQQFKSVPAFCYRPGMRRLFSAMFWVFFAVSGVLCLIVAFVLWVVTTPFDPQRRINHRFSCFWAAIYAWVYPGWRLRVTGRSNIRSDQAYVIIANHTSMADIVLMFCLFRQFKWVSKASVFNYPILGWNMRMCRYIPLVRGDKASISKMLDTCEQWLRKGMSIVMFPEGTRSATGLLKPFKHGAFTMARNTGCDIIPVAIHGGHAVIPKHGRVLATKADLWVEILPAISVKSAETVDALAELCRETIRRALAADEREPEHDGLHDE